MSAIGSLLVERGWQQFSDPKQSTIPFLPDEEANALVNDLENQPHAFVLACLMDRQIKAERAWAIPGRIRTHLGGFAIERLAVHSEVEWIDVFGALSMHRFNDKMARVWHAGVQHIVQSYDSNASHIWANRPTSATVVRRFLEFRGAGIKIATMAANILARDFKIELADHYSIDISPDVHIRRVMRRAGLVPENASIEQIIYTARELSPEFPGIIDLSLWEIGQTSCRPTSPVCASCILSQECPRIGVAR